MYNKENNCSTSQVEFVRCLFNQFSKKVDSDHELVVEKMKVCLQMKELKYLTSFSFSTGWDNYEYYAPDFDSLNNTFGLLYQTVYWIHFP